MPEIRPFRALRYDFRRFNGDLSAVLAPPYDVLDQAEKNALLARNSRNIVAIDLPHLPPKDEGPAEAYAKAAATLQTWMAEAILIREDRPALYLYHQTFAHEGREVTRRQFITVIRLHDFGEGIVLPHEQTFGGPKADRLALTKVTRCNLSPVFGLFTDVEGAVAKAFAPIAKRKPDVIGTVEDVKNAVWIVPDDGIIQQVCAALAPKKVFIADGHHRYTTALNYRDHLTQQQRGLPDDHPARYTLIVLASMDDPGCVIQGYSRVLVGAGLTADALMAAWEPGATVCDERQADLVLFDGAAHRSIGVKFTNRAALNELAADHDAAWRALDVAYLHTYLIDKLAAENLPAEPEARYVKSQEGARALARETGGIAVLPRPTPMEQLRAVSEAGELMPQKSTFFFPKVATGLAIHQLYEGE